MKNTIGLIVTLALVGAAIAVLGGVFHWPSEVLAVFGLAAGVVATGIYDAKRGVQ